MDYRHFFETTFQRLSRAPVAVAFVMSLVLSAIAVLGTVTVGKDAALYLDIARQVSEEGWAVARLRFDWPGFIFLLAGTHTFLGLSLEMAGYLWCAFFMAGSCGLLVGMVRRVRPEAAWWACLAVLAVPAFNEQRDDVLREFGFWFFTALTLWLTTVWCQRGGWWWGACIHLAIGMAVVFRLEALLLLPALFLFQLPRLTSRNGWVGLWQLSWVPLLALLIGLILLADSEQGVQRMTYYLQMIDPRHLNAALEIKARALSSAVFSSYIEDQAKIIFLCMLFSTVLLFFFTCSGPLGLLFLSGSGWRALASFWRGFRMPAVAAVLYVGVLVVFFLQQGFINSRYASYLHLLCVPLFSLALLSFNGQFPRVSRILVGLLLLMMFSNVISTGAKKTHYLETGAWLAENIEKSPDIYFEDARVAYYAGWGYPVRALSRDQAMAAGQVDAFTYLVVEVKPSDTWLEPWLAANHRKVLASFTNRKHRSMLVIGR